jgi:hypothetical protein
MDWYQFSARNSHKRENWLRTGHPSSLWNFTHNHFLPNQNLYLVTFVKCMHFESKPLVTHQRYIEIRAAVTEWCTWVQAKEPTLKLQVVRVTESLSVVQNPTEFMRIWRKCVMKLQNKSWIALILWEINKWNIKSITYSNSWTRASAMQLRYLTSLLSARNAIVKVTALAWSPSRLALFERKNWVVWHQSAINFSNFTQY